MLQYASRLGWRTNPKGPQVRNEIAVLKKVSSGHRNIVTLHDYFEVRATIASRDNPG